MNKTVRRAVAAFMVAMFLLPLAGMVRGALSGVEQVALYDARGTKHTLSDYRNHPVALVFWATWCNECDRVVRDASNFRPRGMTVVAVHETISENNGRAAKAEAMRRKYAVPVLYDELGDAARTFGIERLPTVILLNRKHQVVGVLPGGVNSDRLRSELQRAVRA